MNATATKLSATRVQLVAMAAGLLLFTVVAVVLRQTGYMEPVPETARILPWIALFVAACEIPAYFLLRHTLVSRAAAARQEALTVVEDGRIPQPLHVLAIAGAALAEAVGLLGILTVLVGGTWIALVAPLLAVALIVLQIPTEERVRHAVQGG